MAKTTISATNARKLGKLFGINYKVVPFREWHNGLNVELEHGKMFGKLTNVTNNNHLVTARIAIAHLLEDPMYYYFLKKIETKREKYWKNKGTPKPSIFTISKKRIR